MPSNRPASTCERSSGQRAARQPPRTVVGRLGPHRGRLGRASWRSATPTASSAKITATMWAKYQVLPTAAAHHHTVPVANRTVASARTASRIRRPPSIHHATPTPIAAQGDRDRLLVHPQPDRRDERQEHERREGRERQQHLPRRLPARVEQRVDVVEVPVRRSVGAVRDRPVERNAFRAGRRPPARRNGCTGCSARGWTTCTGPARRTPATARPRRPRGDRRRAGARGARQGPRLYSGPPSTLRRRLPVSGLGSGAPGRETMTDETPRRGIGWRILAIVVIGLVFRLIMAYGVLRTPGIRVRRRTSGCSGSGPSNLADQGPFGFYDRGFFADYTPGYLYRAVAGGRRRPVPRRRRRPDQAAGDPHRRRARLHRLPDGPRPRRQRAAGDDRRRGGDREPDHLVRLGGLGPGRQLRDGVPAARRSGSCGRRAASGPRSSRSSRRW